MNVTPKDVIAVDTATSFVYRHAISFEETNVVGNVYYAKHISWQGRCREMFLKTHASGVLEEIYADLRLVTLNVSCDYYEELHAFDEVEIHLRLDGIWQHRIGMNFEYYHDSDGEKRLTAVGRQNIGCMRATGTGLVPVSPPEELRIALETYAR